MLLTKNPWATALGGKPMKKNERNTPEPYIQLLHLVESNTWTWVLFVGVTAKATAPRTYPTLSGASRNAYSFRALIEECTYCEIKPPIGHKYSGG